MCDLLRNSEFVSSFLIKAKTRRQFFEVTYVNFSGWAEKFDDKKCCCIGRMIQWLNASIQQLFSIPNTPGA